MRKKLSFVIILAMLFAACSASPTEAVSGDGPVGAAVENSDRTQIQPGPETIPEETHIHSPEYFLFDLQRSTYEDDGGVVLFYEQYCASSYTAEDSERAAWVGSVLNSIAGDFHLDSTNLKSYAEEFVEEYGTEQFYAYSNYQDLGITRHDDTVICLVSISSIYSGGAHPSAVQTAYNLDMRSAKLLRLEDVVYPDGAEALAGLVQSRVEQDFGSLEDSALFPDYRNTITQVLTYGSMTPYWYLNDSGLVVFFNQYELGPYAAGIIRTELSYEDLDGILREEFLPPVFPGDPGKLLTKGTRASATRIPITIELEGQTLLIGVEGMVHQVQLSEIRWLDGTPINEELLFSAKSLCENDILEVIGGFDDDTRSFCLEFFSTTGEQRRLYLTPEGLSETP